MSQPRNLGEAIIQRWRERPQPMPPLASINLKPRGYITPIPRIIGIGHRSEHGKDTFANYMIEWLRIMRPDLNVRKLSWAWKLKDVCHQLYGHLGLREPEFYETPEGRALRNIKLPKINKTPVEIWIDMGTPAVRESVWDETWVEFVKADSQKFDVTICADTRFPNEVAACDVAIKVKNTRIAKREGKSVDDVLDSYTGWHHHVLNDLGYSELRGQANMLCAKLFGST